MRSQKDTHYWIGNTIIDHANFLLEGYLSLQNSSTDNDYVYFRNQLIDVLVDLGIYHVTPGEWVEY